MPGRFASFISNESGNGLVYSEKVINEYNLQIDRLNGDRIKVNKYNMYNEEQIPRTCSIMAQVLLNNVDNNTPIQSRSNMVVEYFDKRFAGYVRVRLIDDKEYIYVDLKAYKVDNIEKIANSDSLYNDEKVMRIKEYLDASYDTNIYSYSEVKDIVGEWILHLE